LHVSPGEISAPEVKPGLLRSRRLPARYAVVAMPAVLVAVALLQMVRVAVNDMTPWKGGGFGMFSTVDSLTNRVVRIDAEVGDVWIAFDRPAYDAVNTYGPTDIVRRAAAMPDDGALRRLADAVFSIRWKLAPDGTLRADGSGVVGSIVEPSSLRIVVSGSSFDPNERVLARTLLRDRIIERSGGGGAS
jgi:hypothetical protein